MNERIKELKLQAQLFALDKCNGLPHGRYVPRIDILMDKFAELIIKECIDLVEYNSHGAAKDIKEHFGVTE